MSRAFRANFATHCSRDDCPDPRIVEGELIRYGDENKIEHEACPEPPSPPEVCSGCFLALPLSGVCEECG